MQIDKEKLLKVLETVKPGLGKNEIIEQSKCFVFVDGFVITYNDEISVRAEIPGMELTGAVIADELYSFLSKVKVEEMQLEITEKEIQIKAGRAKAWLTLQADISLPVDEVGEIKKWKKIPDDFIKGLQFALGAVGRDMSKPILTCVNIKKEQLNSSDNYRIAHYQLASEMPVKEFNLPASACREVIKFKSSSIAEGTGWIHFKNESGAIMSCRVFDDQYPDASKYLAASGDTIEFPNEMNAILERAEVFAKRDSCMDEFIDIYLSEKKLEVKSNSEMGGFEESKRVVFAGEPIHIQVTPHLLRDILKTTNTATKDGSKLLFEGENFKYLILLRNV
jgi:DNA polymerase III sliding clamp (beta) subunit (PCNA family)